MLEHRPDFRCLGGLLLSLEALRQAEHRPAVVRIVFEILPIDSLGLGKAAGFQECGAAGRSRGGR